jgi:uncharacterized protein (TIGR02996 family)
MKLIAEPSRMFRLPPFPDLPDRERAIEQHMVRTVLQQPPTVTEPVRPFPHVPEIVDDPRISGFLALQDGDLGVWYARWSAKLSEYPRGEVAVHVSVQASVNVVQNAGPEAGYYRSVGTHGGQRVADWSEVLPLLREVAEDPGDRDRRLVFADYLDDLGQTIAADSLRTLIAQPALWYAGWWRHPVFLQTPPSAVPSVPIEQIRQDFFTAGA